MSSTKKSIETDVDVLIVGLGTGGLSLAKLLADSGVRVAAVDPNRLICQHPRATHIDDETMRMFQALGLADLEPNYLRFTGMEMRDTQLKTLLQLDMPDIVSDQGWHTDYQQQQPDVESRLRGDLELSPHAELHLGWKVTSFEQDDDLVTAEIADRHTDATRTITARYLVGADGASSFVRSALGVNMEDLQGTHRSLIIDVWPLASKPNLPETYGFYICERENPLIYLPIQAPMQRFEFMLRDHHDTEEYERPSTVYRLMRRWYEPGEYRILRTDVYQWHARIAEKWRVGRVFLAGDAAHLMPPMLGQGMCSGLRDAFNLAWKLRAVLKAGADDSLLDTYQSERSDAVRPYVAESARQAVMIETLGLRDEQPEVMEPQVIERYRPPLGPGLSVSEGAVGQLAPQPMDADGARLDDLVGYQFLVVASDADVAAVSEEVRATWVAINAVVLDPGAGGLSAWLEGIGARNAIIRPDRYVFAVASDATELTDATERIASRLSPVPEDARVGYTGESRQSRML